MKESSEDLFARYLLVPVELVVEEIVQSKLAASRVGNSHDICHASWLVWKNKAIVDICSSWHLRSQIRIFFFKWATRQMRMFYIIRIDIQSVQCCGQNCSKAITAGLWLPSGVCPFQRHQGWILVRTKNIHLQVLSELGALENFSLVYWEQSLLWIEPFYPCSDIPLQHSTSGNVGSQK